MSKYKAVKTKVDGIVFDSKKEAMHYLYLKGLEKQGTITELQLQPKFEYKLRKKKMFTYIADFAYKDEFGWHVVNVKGVRTPVFNLKKKIIEAEYEIEIEIV